MRTADIARRAIALQCTLFMLTACGSGNLGTVGSDPNVALSTPSDGGRQSPIIPPGYCGDGVVQASSGEQCDGSDLGGYTCMNLGRGAGLPGCDPVTCQFVIGPCTQTTVGMAGSLDTTTNGGAGAAALSTAGASGAAGAAGAGTAGAAGSASAGGKAGAGGTPSVASPCPLGFACATPLFDVTQTTCMSWAEETPPVCFTPATDTFCATQLPGSTCTNTNLGTFCLLSCTP